MDRELAELFPIFDGSDGIGDIEELIFVDGSTNDGKTGN